MSNLAQRWTYRHGIKGLGNSDVVDVEHSRPIVISDPSRALAIYGLYGRVGQADVLVQDPPPDIELAMYGPYGSRSAEMLGRGRLGQEGDIYLPPDFTTAPDPAYVTSPGFDLSSLTAPQTPTTDILALPDGTTVDATGATYAFDPASQQNYLVTADGTKIFDDGTVLKPGGDIMTPGGTVVHSDGSLTLANGDRVAGSTPTPDGSTVAASVAQWFKVGVDVASGVSGLLGKLGIITPTRPAAGAVKSGWVSGTQYRTTTGAVVTPVKLADGLYQLPDGSKVGAPPSSGTGTLLLIGGAIAAAFAFMRGRKTAAA